MDNSKRPFCSVTLVTKFSRPAKYESTKKYEGEVRKYEKVRTQSTKVRNRSTKVRKSTNSKYEGTKSKYESTKKYELKVRKYEKSTKKYEKVRNFVPPKNEKNGKKAVNWNLEGLLRLKKKKKISNF